MSVLFALLLFFLKSKKSLADIFLNIFIILLAIIQLEFFLVNSGERAVALRMLIIFTPAFQSLPIVKYLYIKSLSSLEPISKKSWLHFTASILSLMLLLVINLFFNDFIKQDAYWNLLIFLIIGVTLVLNLIYIPKSIIVYRKHKISSGNLFSYNEGVDLKWMRLSIVGYIFFFVSIAIIEIFDFTGDAFFLPIVYSVYLFYLIINGLKQKPIYNVLTRTLSFKPAKLELEFEKMKDLSLDDSTQEHDKYKTSSLQDDTKIAEIANSLTHYLDTTKAFLNPGLNLMDVSRQLGINYKYISQAINIHFQKNFIRLVSEYRVEESKQMICDPSKSDITLEAIGELCGFQSKSTFYSAFKKITGKTPMQFKIESTIKPTI
jgi:AraC-like DNA-binding protein